MWTYIIRRLLVMIPTLFGVTIVSFVIMQLAPGDPLLNQLGASGTAGQSSQTREAFLIQKRDLKLDKPLLLNNRYFKNYSGDMSIAATYRALNTDEIASRLERLAEEPSPLQDQEELGFLRKLGIPKFNIRLHPPDLNAEQLAASHLTEKEWMKEREGIRRGLARAVEGYLQVWLEDIGFHGVPATIQLLRSDDTPRLQKIGAVNCLASMVISPFAYTFPREVDEQDELRVISTWRRLWEFESKNFGKVDHDREKYLRTQLEQMSAASRSEMFKALQSGKFSREDVPFFADVLLGDSSRNEKVVAAEFLRLFITTRVQLEAARDVSDAKLQEIIGNWIAHYESMLSVYQPSFLKKTYLLFTDTQYAHMVWRLVTFQFGRSALKTRDPVSKLLWDAFWVSAPLMLLAQLVIYLVAVPAGVVAAINRNNWIDRGTTLFLFLLYSVPPFVAAMLFLLLFAYGTYWRWFPMERLHSDGAENYSSIGYVLDYLWHAVGPVLCLSVFSLAGLAMYGRSAMLDVLGQDFIRTAIAKGASRYTVVVRHALPNGMIPIITLFSSFIPALLGGSVLIEYLFNINGMGRLSFISIQQKDFPTLMALVYVDAIVVMLSILLSDLLYVVFDPRITFEGKSA